VMWCLARSVRPFGPVGNRNVRHPPQRVAAPGWVTYRLVGTLLCVRAVPQEVP
jgi:hypothetical protein